MSYGHLNIFKSIFKNIKTLWETWFDFLTILPGVRYDHGSETNKKLKMGKLNLSKKEQKVIKVDVTKASLTHAMKKVK